jgi:hypothetical protein
MSSIGPASNTPFKITRAISENLLAHTKYVSNLRLWDKFLIWVYTLGSGALNFTLIGIAKDEQKVFWTFNFFKRYNYSEKDIDKEFKKYLSFFNNPSSYLSDRSRIIIAQDIILGVINSLQRIIKKAPRIRESFDVYKVSSSYPQLDNLEQTNNIIHQVPFNSTSYNPQFNFAPFISENSTCCLHKITVPSGSRVLFIPSEYHAYPMELELLLPFNSNLLIKSITQEGFNFIPKEQQKFIPVQDLNNLVIGQVYMYDPLSSNIVIRKKLKYYVSKLET